MVAGYHAGIADAIRSYVLAQGGAREATLLPHGQKTTAALAGLAHGSYIHGLELSDAAPRATVHPGKEIVPAALAYAERHRVGGAAMLPAVAAGYEVEIRIGRSVFPGAFYRGWWTPGVFGAIGSAVTAGYLLGLDATRLSDAIGIVMNLLPATTTRANEEGQSFKWLIGGHACGSGLLAAEMAARGATGMRDIVNAWLPVISDEYHAERLTEGISSEGAFEQWELLSGILTKYYATVGCMTVALDETFDLIMQHDINAREIDEIEVECMQRLALFDTRHPENELAARASLPYCLAVAACTRDRSQLLGPAFRPEMLADPAVRAVADKVRIIVNEEYERQYPARSMARITFRMRNGACYTREGDRSARARYLTPADRDIEDKFRLIATSVLGAKKTERVIALVQRLETLPDVRELIDALCIDA